LARDFANRIARGEEAIVEPAAGSAIDAVVMQCRQDDTGARREGRS
jgi:hypothetical protein